METANFLPISPRSKLGVPGGWMGEGGSGPWVPGCPGVSEAYLSTSLPCTAGLEQYSDGYLLLSPRMALENTDDKG